MLASAFLQLDLYKGLTFKTIASYNYYTKGYNGYTAYNDRTFGTQDRKDSFSLNQSQSTSLGLEAFLNYDWSNEHHRVSAMAGFSTSERCLAEFQCQRFPGRQHPQNFIDQ